MENSIVIENLKYKYPDQDFYALDGINLKIQNGEKVGIVGPNGAGKSTLLLHLNGLLKGEGKVFVNGIEVNSKNLKNIRKWVGLVFQNSDCQLFMPTVFEDISFGLLYTDHNKEEIEKKVDSIISQLDLSELKNRAVYHLSEGEKKLVALATVLVLNPVVLALDEPTAGLDPKARRKIINILKERKETQIIASHDLESIVELTDRVILLFKGKIITDGETKNILSNEKLMDQYELEVPHILYSGYHRHK